MRFIIVTGLSGAGKSEATNALEDMGYFCVDNLPIELILKFAELTFSDKNSNDKNVALGIDIRSGQALSELDYILDRQLLEYSNQKRSLRSFVVLF